MKIWSFNCIIDQFMQKRKKLWKALSLNMSIYAWLTFWNSLKTIFKINFNLKSHFKKPNYIFVCFASLFNHNLYFKAFVLRHTKEIYARRISWQTISCKEKAFLWQKTIKLSAQAFKISCKCWNKDAWGRCLSSKNQAWSWNDKLYQMFAWKH